jgi:hypothetical protein
MGWGHVSNDAARAFAMCAALAEEHTHATGTGRYADGFRAAAKQIAQHIARLRDGLPPSRLERDLRDAEVVARTLARVVSAAERICDELDEGSEGAKSLRALLAVFYAHDELPSKLRERTSSRVLRVNAPSR